MIAVFRDATTQGRSAHEGAAAGLVDRGYSATMGTKGTGRAIARASTWTQGKIDETGRGNHLVRLAAGRFTPRKRRGSVLVLQYSVAWSTTS